MSTVAGIEFTASTLAHIRWKAAHFRAGTMSCNYTERKVKIS